jgi:hypothetical protein
MPDRQGEPPTRARRSNSSSGSESHNKASARARVGRGANLRARLKRDPFLFLLCIAALAFTSWAFALTWWVTGALAPLVVALIAVGPAIGLFYLRDA